MENKNRNDKIELNNLSASTKSLCTEKIPSRVYREAQMLVNLMAKKKLSRPDCSRHFLKDLTD